MDDSSGPAGGIPVWPVVAAVAGAIGFLPPILNAASSSEVVLDVWRSAGWTGFAFGAAVVLDRDSTDRIGRTLLAVALVPLVVTVAALLPQGGGATWQDVGAAWRGLGVVPLVVTIAALAWAMGMAPDRLSRRRIVWLAIGGGLLILSAALAGIGSGPGMQTVVTIFGLWSVSAIVVVTSLASALRPVDEPLLDIGLTLAVLGLGAGTGFGTHRAVRVVDGALSGTIGALVGVTVATAALAIGVGLRRQFLTRRYGTGALTPDDVAAITIDLRGDVESRQILAKAAAMVRGATGHREVRITLDSDSDVEPPWVYYPLLVGGGPVGTLVINPLHAEGPEARQHRILQQLLPTVALLVKAVQSAVAAEAALRQMDREREAERKRILADLHDGIGPMLAGMSMRVQAQVRSRPEPWLQSLADDLADARGDLRRLVSGLTPAALEHGDLTQALQELVSSFAGSAVPIDLQLDLVGDIPQPAAVTAYRTAAEGLTNALRHAAPQALTLRAGIDSGRLIVEVIDDGIGGAVVPGVGLSSLRQRASELGGQLTVSGSDGSGTWLRVELPLEAS